MNPFRVARQPALTVEAGAIRRLPSMLDAGGYRAVAIVTGGRSVRGKNVWSYLTDTLLERGIDVLDFTVRGEPDPGTVDRFRDEVLRDLPECSVVVAIGGGSVIDAAKALAALLGMQRGTRNDRSADTSISIRDFLEGVGSQTPTGETLPVIAVPTTAGTGSEATKNAVLSSVGADGFKKSLRHDNYVPGIAILDPELHLGAPGEVTRASGLDAITQLIEVYVSTEANPITDALALTGMQHAGRGFPALVAGDDSLEARMDMAIAAYLSGVGLASAGLGVVHGVASPMGALRDIPHGVVCGITLGPSIDVSLRSTSEGSDRAQKRYALAAAALGAASGEISDKEFRADSSARRDAATALVERLSSWASDLPRLSAYGFTATDLAVIAGKSGLKNHPVALTSGEVESFLSAVL